MQLLPGLQSWVRSHGRTQYPLMQESMPHCELLEHVFPPQVVMLRHAPARQNSPWWHSSFAEQTELQCPPLHDSPAAQSFAVVHLGSVEQVPDLHAQLLLQSEVPVQAYPGQPKRHSSAPAPESTKVHALVASSGNATKKRLRNFKASIELSL